MVGRAGAVAGACGMASHDITDEYQSLNYHQFTRELMDFAVLVQLKCLWKLEHCCEMEL